jgi:hypothetical protein
MLRTPTQANALGGLTILVLIMSSGFAITHCEQQRGAQA